MMEVGVTEPLESCVPPPGSGQGSKSRELGCPTCEHVYVGLFVCERV